jgi:hypothetical protein
MYAHKVLDIALYVSLVGSNCMLTKRFIESTMLYSRSLGLATAAVYMQQRLKCSHVLCLLCTMFEHYMVLLTAVIGATAVAKHNSACMLHLCEIAGQSNTESEQHCTQQRVFSQSCYTAGKRTIMLIQSVRSIQHSLYICSLLLC